MLIDLGLQYRNHVTILSLLSSNTPLSCTVTLSICGFLYLLWCVVCVCRSFLAGWHHTVYFIKGAEKSSSYHPSLEAKFLFLLFSFFSVSALRLQSFFCEKCNSYPTSIHFHPESPFISHWTFFFIFALPGPNSTSPTTTVLSRGQHLLVETTWTTWLLSLLSPRYACRQPPWTHTHTTRYTHTYTHTKSISSKSRRVSTTNLIPGMSVVTTDKKSHIITNWYSTSQSTIKHIVYHPKI